MVNSGLKGLRACNFLCHFVKSSFYYFSPFFLFRCYLQGEREGEVEVFTDNMPGYPDNIRLGSRDTYWVAMTATRNRSVVKYWEVLGPYPLLKLICYKVIQIRQHPLVIAILKKVGWASNVNILLLSIFVAFIKIIVIAISNVNKIEIKVRFY